MASYSEDARRYRDRAEELRTKADGFATENQGMLLRMAEYYDHFAEQLERDAWDHRIVKP